VFELEVLHDGEVTDQLSCENEVVRLGRDQRLEVWLPDPTLSKHHATIRKAGDAYVLVDEASTNGTFVNEQRVSRRALNEGDLIRLGSYTLRFQHGLPLWMRLREPKSPKHASPATHAALGFTYAQPTHLERGTRERSSPVTARLSFVGQGVPPVVVDRDVFLVGAGEGCHLRLKAPEAPRIAAVFVRSPSGWQLVPTTGEGVVLEDQVVRERLWLRNEDRLSFGEVTVVFRAE
jgi:hypothetical protein